MVRIFLPTDVPSNNVHIEYYLYGAFGAHGESIRPKPKSPAVMILPVVEDKIAEEIKLFAVAPGCDIKTFDIPISSADVDESFACEPVPTVNLKGRVSDRTLLEGRHAEVRIDYLAHWACSFFELIDCLVPQVPMGIATLSTNGDFEIELPDLSADSTFREAEFQVVLRQVETWNVIAFLEPESANLQKGGGLKVAASYTVPVTFQARKRFQPSGSLVEGVAPDSR